MSPKALINGAGIGGLACAAMLERAGWKVVIVRAQHKTGENKEGIGIWSNALCVLEKMLPNTFSTLLEKGTFVTNVAGYTNSQGDSLLGPKADLGCVHNFRHRPSLLFLERSELLTALLSESSKVEYVTETKGSNKIDFDSLNVDLVIGADGMNSKVADDFVYRGISTNGSAIKNNGSFQSLGERGMRFAAVPMSHGRASWFCTCIVIEQYRTNEKNEKNETSESNSELSQELSVVHRISKEFQPSAFELVSSTPLHSFSKPIKARYHHRRCTKQRISHCGKAVLIGDAGHTLDPILAHGAGIAIENAVELVHCLSQWKPSDGRQALSKHLGEFERCCNQRILLLDTMGQISDFFGQTTKFPRDFVCKITPDVISSSIFELGMKAALAPSYLNWTYNVPSTKKY